MKKKIMMDMLSAIALLASASPALAATTPWFDRDNPGGDGDWETWDTLVTKVECKFTQGGASTAGQPGYLCGKQTGSQCRNSPAIACNDTQVRYTFSDGIGPAYTTPWLNRDLPGGDGDFEIPTLNFTVACRTVAPPKSPVTTGGAYRCGSPNVLGGGSGSNAQNGGQQVKDIEVQFTF
jgi:hypothetical protein